jgi:hypothetical protein
VSRIGGASEHVQMVTKLVVSILPEAERLGLVTPGEIDPRTLLDRVLADVTASGSAVIGWPELEPGPRCLRILSDLVSA